MTIIVLLLAALVGIGGLPAEARPVESATLRPAPAPSPSPPLAAQA